MAAHIVRLSCPARIRALLFAVVLVVAALATAPASSALTPDDYIFIPGICPTTVPGYNFSGSSPNGIAVDANGNVYVTLPMIRPDANGLSGTVYQCTLTIGTKGSFLAQFDFPTDVAVDGNHLYVADKNNNRIQKFAIDYVADTLAWEDSWGANYGNSTAGSADGEFSIPTGIATDHNGHLFVADKGNDRIQELTTAGVFVAKWGVGYPFTNDHPLYLSNLNQIDADAHGNVYVTDCTDTTSWLNNYRPGLGGSYGRATRLDRPRPHRQGGSDHHGLRRSHGLEQDAGHGHPDTERCSLENRSKDTVSPRASVRIRIYKGAKLCKRLSLGLKGTNANLKYSCRCTLAKGKYTWKVYATDLAGNVQSKPGVRKLTVK